MNARDYICRNYLKLAMLAKEAVSENRIFLVKGINCYNKQLT